MLAYLPPLLSDIPSLGPIPPSPMQRQAFGYLHDRAAVAFLVAVPVSTVYHSPSGVLASFVEAAPPTLIQAQRTFPKNHNTPALSALYIFMVFRGNGRKMKQGQGKPNKSCVGLVRPFSTLRGLCSLALSGSIILRYRVWKPENS
jgi:hypothetical protein